MGEREQGEPEAWVLFLESAVPGRTQVGGGVAYLGKVSSRWRSRPRSGPRKMNGESWLRPGDKGEDKDGDMRVSSAGMAAHTVMGQMLKLDPGLGLGGFSELQSPNPFLITTRAVLKL